MDEKKLRPGDVGYKGGSSYVDIQVKGENRRVYYVKDENGNIVSVTERPLILGIF